MLIECAKENELQAIARLDAHVPPVRLEECVRNGQVYVLKDDFASDGGGLIVGVLRYSLFWQTIPFLDLLYLEEAWRHRGFGTQIMCAWETAMQARGYRHVMTSTQADETAWQFYEKLGYRKVGGFFPPEQEAEEWMYRKKLGK